MPSPSRCSPRWPWTRYPHLVGTASGSNNLLRNLGFTLGPPIVATISLSLATNHLHRTIADTPTLEHALALFNALPGHAPVAEQPMLRAAVAAVNSGPLGANAVPATITRHGQALPFNPLKEVAFYVLSYGSSIGYLVCGVAALAATVAAFALLRARSPHGVERPSKPDEPDMANGTFLTGTTGREPARKSA